MRGQLNTPEAFWARYDKTGSVPKHCAELGSCWVWTGARGVYGYGHLSYRRRMMQAHRLAFELTYGPLAPGEQVCHHCDNPPCGNPAHLFRGTQLDNVRDMTLKGHHRGGGHGGKLGSARAFAKLSEAVIPEILSLARAGVSHRKIALRFGVSRQAIDHVLAGTRWRHVTGFCTSKESCQTP